MTETTTRPVRQKGEDFGDWLRRLDAWGKTDEGRRESEAARAEDARRQQQSDAKKAIQRFDECGIPERYRGILVAPEATKAMAAVAKFTGGGIYVLSGGPGCGKTIAACWWAWSKAGRFEKAGRLARRSHWDGEVDKLLTVPVLALDDLGVEYQDAKGFFASLLDELLDTRYENSRPTLITTNLPRDEFAERCGGRQGRIASRIAGEGAFFSLSDADMRRRSA